MKASITSATPQGFQPVTIALTFNSFCELNALSALFNNSQVMEAFRKTAGLNICSMNPHPNEILRTLGATDEFEKAFKYNLRAEAPV